MDLFGALSHPCREVKRLLELAKEWRVEPQTARVQPQVRSCRQGWSLARIAERHDTTAGTVRTRLLEVGVRMREPWEGGSH